MSHTKSFLVNKAYLGTTFLNNLPYPKSHPWVVCCSLQAKTSRKQCNNLICLQSAHTKFKVINSHAGNTFLFLQLLFFSCWLTVPFARQPPSPFVSAVQQNSSKAYNQQHCYKPVAWSSFVLEWQELGCISPCGAYLWLAQCLSTLLIVCCLCRLPPPPPFAPDVFITRLQTPS